MLIGVRFDVLSFRKWQSKNKKEIHYRSKTRKFKTKNTSQVWGNKFDCKAISKWKIYGLLDS